MSARPRWYLLRWYPLRVAAAVDAVAIALWCLVVAVVPVEQNLALVALAVVVVGPTLAALSCSVSSARAWALAAGVRFSPAIEVQLHRHLCRMRVARTVGVTGALATSLMVGAHYNADPAAFPAFLDGWNDILGGYWLPAAGYVLASVLVEVRKPDAVTGSPSAAVLSRRRLEDFLDPRVRDLLGIAIVVLALAIAVAALSPRSSGLGGSGGTSGSLVTVVLPVAVAALAAAAALWVCRRREHAEDEAGLAFEELTRAATANALAGATIAMLTEAAARAVWSPGPAGAISGWFIVPFGLCSTVGLMVWIGCGTRLAIRNRRIGKLRTAAGVAPT